MSTQAERSSPLVLYACAFVVAVWTVHIVLRQMYEPGHMVRLIATGLLIAGFSFFVVAEVRLIRQLDEFQRHVQLLALAIGFGCSLVAAVGIGFLRAEGLLRQADPRDLPSAMLFLYLVGAVIARRRYQ